MDTFLVAWSGGYEPPAYKVAKTDVEAWRIAESWRSQINHVDGEYIDILRIDTNLGEVERIGGF